jgi:hypothetical protein
MTKLTGVERLRVWNACGTPITMDASAIAAIVEVLEDIAAAEERLAERRQEIKRSWWVLLWAYAVNLGLLALHWWVA